MVSSTDREERKKSATLVDLILETIGGSDAVEAIGDRSWAKDERPLGADFTLPAPDADQPQ